MRFLREEQGQTLVIVLALVGLVSALAYGYMGLASTTNQQSTLRVTQLAEYRASDGGATYSLWYAKQKGFPPPGVVAAPDPGDGLGAPAVTLADLRPGLSFGPLANKGVYNSVAHTLTGAGDVFFTFTWTTDAAGKGSLAIRFDTTPTQASGFAAQATVTMPAGAVSTTSSVTLPTSGPGTYYLHIEMVVKGANVSSVDGNGAAPGHFTMNYPGMRFQAISSRTGRTTALDAGLTRNGGVYTAVVNSWTLR
ncbi:MAG: hypothetical protein AUH85_00385 [Chloroflexi bacterium 13_1_40CM_4_68_4]|nr:MAG: hypothetical protein AUH85_00385 [Chloroflexi bacterium 13_1_40CM_4_68_4]